MTNLDETKLARLEALADNYFKCVSLPFEESAYRELAIHYCPALVAEVRRLREKVEAWEWLWECFNLWLSMPSMPTITEDGRVELWYIRKAARESVHAAHE